MFQVKIGFQIWSWTAPTPSLSSSSLLLSPNVSRDGWSSSPLAIVDDSTPNQQRPPPSMTWIDNDTLILMDRHGMITLVTRPSPGTNAELLARRALSVILPGLWNVTRLAYRYPCISVAALVNVHRTFGHNNDAKNNDESNEDENDINADNHSNLYEIWMMDTMLNGIFAATIDLDNHVMPSMVVTPTVTTTLPPTCEQKEEKRGRRCARGGPGDQQTLLSPLSSESMYWRSTYGHPPMRSDESLPEIDVIHVAGSTIRFGGCAGDHITTPSDLPLHHPKYTTSTKRAKTAESYIAYDKEWSSMKCTRLYRPSDIVGSPYRACGAFYCERDDGTIHRLSWGRSQTIMNALRDHLYGDVIGLIADYAASLVSTHIAGVVPSIDQMELKLAIKCIPTPFDENGATSSDLDMIHQMDTIENKDDTKRNTTNGTNDTKDGLGSVATFIEPMKMTLNDSGTKLYVIENQPQSIRIIDLPLVWPVAITL
jgi:hypothetical protein